MTIKGYDVATVLKTTWKEIGEDKISVYAGQMAYAAFFSLFPLLLFFAALLSLVGDQSTVQAWFNSRIASALPDDVAGLLGTTIEKVVFAKGAPGILSFGLLTAAWAGSGVFGALRVALNDAYDVEETRPRWKLYALQLGIMGLTGAVLLLATIILLNGEGVMAWLGARLGLGRVTTLLWTIIQYPLAVGALVAVLWLIYYLLPNCRHQNKRLLLFGATLSAALWIAATLVFRLYVQRFNALNPAYGAIGAIMMLLTWLYYSNFVFLAVGELNAVLQSEQDRRAGVVSRTTGRGEGVPREHALVPLGAASGRRPEPRWAARQRADGDGRPGHDLRRFALFRIVDRVKGAIDFSRTWVDGTVTRLREDVATARREVGEVLGAIGRGTAVVAVGGVLALLGTISLITGVILLVGDQWIPSDLYWAAALLITLLAAAIALWLARRGQMLFRGGLIPRATVESMREDREVLAAAVAGRRGGMGTGRETQ